MKRIGNTWEGLARFGITWQDLPTLGNIWKHLIKLEQTFLVNMIFLLAGQLTQATQTVKVTQPEPNSLITMCFWPA